MSASVHTLRMYNDLGLNRTTTAIAHTAREINNFWGIWNLRAMILFSFLLYILLTLCSPLRKRTSEAFVIQFIITAFSLADSTSKTAIGLYSGTSTSVDPRIQSLWSCFLLIHLGGPDSITASSSEDITTYARNILTLLAQAFFTTYLRVLSTFEGNVLFGPTGIVLACGAGKLMGRVISLRLAHPDSIRNALLPKCDREEPRHQSPDSSHHIQPQLPTIAQANNNFTELDVVENAYKLLNVSKGLIVDLIPSSEDCRVSRRLFLTTSPRDAFEILVVELHFLYDIIYTKIHTITSPLLQIFRLVTFFSFCVAAALFHIADKKGIKTQDIVITFILFLGTISLEVVAIFMILFSDWAAVYLNRLTRPQSCLWEVVIKVILVAMKKLRWSSHYSDGKDPTAAFSLGWLVQRNRFCHRINQDNLIRMSLHPPRRQLPRSFKTYLSLLNLPSTEKMFGFSVEKTKVTSNLRDIVFLKLKEKKPKADSRNSLALCGDWIFNDSNGCSHLLPWSDDFEFDKAVLVWNIATDLCSFETMASRDSISKGKDSSLRDACKVLSDYIFYLLADERKMLSPIAGIYDLRIIYTCRELRALFLREGIPRMKPNKNTGCFKTSILCVLKCRCKEEEDEYGEIQKRVCRQILDHDASLEPPKKDLSVLSDARKLAIQLNTLAEEIKWEVLSKVWVEFLLYAALSSSGSSHAAKLCKGGEFLSLVWLLSAHLGLGKQYELDEDETNSP